MQTTGSITERQQLIEACPKLSIRKQCELVGISRSGYYYEPCPESEENLQLMRRLDELHMENPVYESRRLLAMLERDGNIVNRKRIRRLLQIMGIEAIYPKRTLSLAIEGHRIYPYLLEGLEINGPDQVWCADITYVPMAYGYMYLVARDARSAGITYRWNHSQCRMDHSQFIIYFSLVDPLESPIRIPIIKGERGRF